MNEWSDAERTTKVESSDARDAPQGTAADHN
jgi:hypothetical protein